MHELIKYYIRPDIIIHQRGSNDKNILWLELKINKKESECSFEKQKAWHAISQLNYKLGISILVDFNKRIILFNWIAINEMERVEFAIENNLLEEKSRLLIPYKPD